MILLALLLASQAQAGFVTGLAVGSAINRSRCPACPVCDVGAFDGKLMLRLDDNTGLPCTSFHEGVWPWSKDVCEAPDLAENILKKTLNQSVSITKTDTSGPYITVFYKILGR